MESDEYDITGLPEAQGMPNIDQMRNAAPRSAGGSLQADDASRDAGAVRPTRCVVGSRRTEDDARTTTQSEWPARSGVQRRSACMPVDERDDGGFRRCDAVGGARSAGRSTRPGLQGRFDFTLTWTPDESQFRGTGIRVPPAPADAKLPGLFTAIQEQIGLRFESVTAPVEVIVIDSAERPSN